MKKTRRAFIQKSAVAAASLTTVAPFQNIFIQTKKIVEENPIVGHGDFKYRVDKEWGIQDPTQFPVNDCHEMILDKKNRIFMTTTHPKNNILVYDRSGKILDAWGTDYPGAHGLTLSTEGEEEFLFITDPDTHKVCKTTQMEKNYFNFLHLKKLKITKKTLNLSRLKLLLLPMGISILLTAMV